MNTVPLTNVILISRLKTILQEVERGSDSAARELRIELIKDNINILKGNITVH